MTFLYYCKKETTSALMAALTTAWPNEFKACHFSIDHDEIMVKGDVRMVQLALMESYCGGFAKAFYPAAGGN